MEGYDASTYGARFADVYDDWYRDVTDTDATVAFLRERAGRGRLLELGVGTGRIAVPLAAAGIAVTGIDASSEMTTQLLAKPGGERVEIIIGDMADVGHLATGPFTTAFVGFNTFFNLPTDDAQRRCLAGVAAALEPDGVLVVEAFVPSPEPSTVESAVEAPTIDADRVVLRVSRRDPVAQTVTGQHIDIAEDGIRLRPWHLHYLRPEQLDTMAGTVGFTLESRAAGWRGESFDPVGSSQHVSVYRRT